MNFDPTQEKEIKKTMTLLVDDMRALYQIYPYENIEFFQKKLAEFQSKSQVSRDLLL